VTHDDCTVRDDWIAAVARHATRTPDAIVTGQVVPDGPVERVPSTRESNVPYDFTGSDAYGVLYPASMVAPRAALLELGGFDERPSFAWAAEDNDLCYRWLRAGRPLRFEPELVVFHHDWRGPAELAELHLRYARAQGAFYAKHLLRGDARMLRFIASDLALGVRSVAGGVRHRRPRWTDERRSLLRGVPLGFLAGARDELTVRRSRRRGEAPSP
jgi:GT2 family glycosyltransferase